MGYKTQLLWKTAWQLLKWLHIITWSSHSTLRYIPKKNKACVHTRTWKRRFTAALFIIARKRKQPRCGVRELHHAWLFVILWTVAHQPLPSTGFFRQEYWNGLLFPTPGDLPDPGIEPASLVSPALTGGFFTMSATWESPTFNNGSWNVPCYFCL